MKARDIARRALAARGTPYRHCGRQAGRGLDCIGLLLHAVDRAESDVPELIEARAAGHLYFADPLWHTQARSAISACGALLQSILDKYLINLGRTGRSVTGDIVAYRVKADTPVPDHIGICVDDGFIIHSTINHGVVVEDKSKLNSRIVSIYRYVS